MKNITILSVLTSISLMAAAPNTGDILRQVKPIEMPTLKKELPSITKEKSITPLDAKDNLKVFVKSFTFSGNTAFSSETLSSLVKQYQGKELGINGLKEVASVITKYYRKHSYFVARAYIPAQSMENDIIEIMILEGNYGKFNIKDSSLVKTAEVQGFMDVLTGGKIVSTNTLERQMLLINNLSGTNVANVEVYPGQEVGTSDFAITTAATPKYNAYAMVDNYGLRYTGENRLNLGGYVNSLTGIGDKLGITGLISNTADIKNIRIGYDRPLGYKGLKGGTSISITDYTIDELGSYEAYGQANQYNVYVSYPYIKTRAHTLSVKLIYDHKLMKDSSGILLVQESRKKIDTLTLQIDEQRSTSFANLPGNLSASVGFTAGNLTLDNTLANNNDVSLNSEGKFAKVVFSANHIQYLRDKLSLKTTFRAQKSFSKNLDSAEDISVAGSNGVRAYEDTELSGDQGYVLSLDLIYNLPKVNLISHNTSMFLDNARVWKNSNIFNNEDNIRNLNALGIGYTINYKIFSLKTTFAHGFGGENTPTSEAEISISTNKFLLQGMMVF